MIKRLHGFYKKATEHAVKVKTASLSLKSVKIPLFIITKDTLAP
jgi:hypothetical protein